MEKDDVGFEIPEELREVLQAAIEQHSFCNFF
jgi:hypothetical protein